MSSIAIIPARGGSKRIPHKNIKEFCGKPIIAYSIEAALESKLFDKVMVSTDDERIAEIAEKYGASVPFLRSAETSNDHAILKDVLVEVLNEYHKLGKVFDDVCCLLSTAPFINQKDLLESHALLSGNTTAVIPVVQFSYTIFRSLKMNEDKTVEMFWPENFATRSQDLPVAYHDAGLFYWYTKEYFEELVPGFGKNARAYELSEIKTQDIDTEEDWKIAEMKYRLLNK